MQYLEPCLPIPMLDTFTTWIQSQWLEVSDTGKIAILVFSVPYSIHFWEHIHLLATMFRPVMSIAPKSGHVSTLGYFPTEAAEKGPILPSWVRRGGPDWSEAMFLLQQKSALVPGGNMRGLREESETIKECHGGMRPGGPEARNLCRFGCMNAWFLFLNG